jgi:NAD+ synthase
VRRNFNPSKEIERVIKWLTEWGKNFTTFVVGMSGGIDSSLTAVLASRVKKTYGILLPCKSSPQSYKNALLVAEKFSIPTLKIGLDETYIILKKTIEQQLGEELALYPDGNLKSRLRAVALYTVANQKNGAVVGTDNYCENYIGYFTKGGDGLVDVNPLGLYFKSEIYAMAEFLGLPPEVIQARPTADLGISEDDESELGFTYPELERAIKHLEKYEIIPSEELSKFENILEKVKALHKKSQHKRELPPVCPRD